MKEMNEPICREVDKPKSSSYMSEVSQKEKTSIMR